VPVRAILVAAACCLVPAAAADTITLTNGRVIEADRAWFEGSQLRYQKDGGTFGLPRTLVQRLDQRSGPEPASDPDILKARERLAANDPAEAIRLLRLALYRDPQSIAAFQALAATYLSLGDAHSARENADRAILLDDRNHRSRALRADALAALGDYAGAAEEYRRSLRLRPDPEIERKLQGLAPPPQRIEAAVRPELSMRYEGGLNEELGAAVHQVLIETYREYTRRLGFRPEDSVTVVLQMGAGFNDGRVPEWADGVNDGTIRVPVQGLDRPTPRLVSVLRHELAHSFIAARTAGNCPTWLQEGIAQWLEGGDPAREDAALAAPARSGRLLPLLALEAPFVSLATPEVPRAYAESLSAVAHILRRRGEAGVVRLLAALGDRLPPEEALPVALALSYPEFQESWEEHLRVADRRPPSQAPSAR
jgi:tetratricopeptide (TPR) repeat protein